MILKHFDIKVTSDLIRYDRRSKSYYVANSLYNRLMKEFIPEKAGKDIIEIGKYTSLNTLVETLKSKKMRLNSIVSMNDKTEINILSDIHKNFEITKDEEGLAVALANDINIISLTPKTDDLNMWRLYGDNAKGVCLIFKRNVEKDDELKKIKYIAPNEINSTNRVKKFLNDLRENDIKFSFNHLTIDSHYIKYDDYKSEDEYRMIVIKNKPDGWFINRDNGLITPYVELKLSNFPIPENVDYFPYTLSSIRLGPAFKEIGINKVQIKQMCMDAGFFNVDIVQSNISSYR